METRSASAFTLLAGALCYPAPGQLAALESGLQALPPGSEKQFIAAFLEQIRRLSIGEWEELHTRTLDLNPPAAPYVGFQIWGESYQRGTFLSKMNRALFEAAVDTEGELPDHLIPVLRYLASTPAPLAELAAVLEQALQRMTAALRKADPGNPYLYLLDAAQEGCKDLKKESA
jgi:nitrate reductase molybdenum cofactor assembly chaperone NarJ/NarW